MDNLKQSGRKNIRAKFHDYCGGTYFITICTADKLHYFGKIVDDKMQLNQLGQYAFDQLNTISSHYNYVEVPLFVVMPNHVHAVIQITDEKAIPKVRSALSVVVGGYKQAVTIYARRQSIQFDWQSRYHDHIIRNSHEANFISEYIKNNPARWGYDCFNSEIPAE